VTAVGTAFDVGLIQQHREKRVTVSEGRVNVAPGTDEAGGGTRTNTETVRASVGQRSDIFKTARRLLVASVDPKIAGIMARRETAIRGANLWRTLSGVVNRYIAPQIVVAPALQQTRFTGTVSPTARS